MRPPLTAVLVLYRELATESLCFRSLHNLLSTEPQLANNFRLLLYDNSPEQQPVPAFPAPIEYTSDPTNGGVASAYNRALQLARENGSQWLLLLDQDTELTSAYLQELFSLTDNVPPSAVAIVPRLQQDGSTHSPSHLPRLSHRPLSTTAAGLLPYTVSVFNSGAAIRVSAIDSFPPRYWLDFLDHAVFHKLQQSGGRVWLMRAALEHRLSTQRLGTEASLGRYLNMLQAERDFYSDYGSPSDRLYYRLRRLKQTLGQLLKVKDKRFAMLSAHAALGLLKPTPPHS